MLIDQVKITVSAGKGGDGLVTFNKNKLSLGPTGGDGGKGGNVYFEGISNIGALRQFRHKKDFYSKNGGNGRRQRMTGADGEDLILKIPVGTVIKKNNTKEILELSKIGQKILIAQGGVGGRGNFSFRSSRNTTPKEPTPGKPGEFFELELELKLIADIGLIGFPNVGKSTLLNLLTNAGSKVANYNFTTLEPHLGVYYELVLADIPGLIEGASEGKGLGHKFLRHIERTATLFHLISAKDPSPVESYLKIRKELEKYNPSLLEKTEYVFLSQSDEITPKEVKSKLNQLKKVSAQSAIAFSILENESLDKVKKILNQIKEEKFAKKSGESKEN